ncbi:MAG TPA: hypothetical protein VGW34_15620 [Allosphingosinicella sp.]|nr:hypothetical protein [Allosphingosinicella sp.]
MIGRALIGAVAAAVAMFIIGFIFFATPLYKIGARTADDAQAAAVQQSLAANLPRTGTYFIPSADTPEQAGMYSRGPVATVHYNSSGFSHSDPGVMIGGFIHMLIVALLIAVGLYTLSRYLPSFAERAKLLILGVLGATIFMRLGEPIWYHHDWAHAIYLLVADSVSLIVAGLIILKLLPERLSRAVPSEEATTDA